MYPISSNKRGDPKRMRAGQQPFQSNSSSSSNRREEEKREEIVAVNNRRDYTRRQRRQAVVHINVKITKDVCSPSSLYPEWHNNNGPPISFSISNSRSVQEKIKDEK
jgi:hypothetical protein